MPIEKTVVEVQGDSGRRQTQCPNVDGFRSVGVVEVTCAYCDLDEQIVEIIPGKVIQRKERTNVKETAGANYWTRSNIGICVLYH